jgi:hypothetical protein
MFDGPAIRFLGTIDGYEIYADRAETFLMHRWVNQKKSNKNKGS